MVSEIMIDKHRSLRDRVSQETEIATAAKSTLRVVAVFEVAWGDVLYKKLFVSASEWGGRSIKWNH